MNLVSSLVGTLAALVSFSTVSLADHREHPQEAIRATYNLADAAEQLYFAARNAGPRDEVGGGLTDDHREESLWELAQQAQNLHLSASRLYHALRDYRPNQNIEWLISDVENDYWQLERIWQDLSRYNLPWHVNSAWNRTANSYQQFQYYVR